MVQDYQDGAQEVQRPRRYGGFVGKVRIGAAEDGIEAGAIRGAGPRFCRRLPLARDLEEADFVALYIRYLLARILRRLAARTISDFLAGPHVSLALPKGDAD